MIAEKITLNDIRQNKEKIEKKIKKEKEKGINIVGSSTVHFNYEENESATRKTSTAIKLFYNRKKKNR